MVVFTHLNTRAHTIHVWYLYLHAVTVKINQMQVNVPYVDGMSGEKLQQGGTTNPSLMGPWVSSTKCRSLGQREPMDRTTDQLPRQKHGNFGFIWNFEFFCFFAWKGFLRILLYSHSPRDPIKLIYLSTKY